MARRRTQATGFTRFLIMLAVMAALFFGVQYVLSSTEWGQELHQDLQESATELEEGDGGE